jgi:hypothetical protein
MDEILEAAIATANAANRCTLAGIESERQANRLRIGALVRAYERAKSDPKTCIPTYLEVLLDELLRDAWNAAADSADKRPQWERDFATGARDPALTR